MLYIFITAIHHIQAQLNALKPRHFCSVNNSRLLEYLWPHPVAPFDTIPPFFRGRVAEQLGHWICNSEGLSLSPTLTTSWICSWQSQVQILDHACKWPTGLPLAANPVMFDLHYVFQEFAWPHLHQFYKCHQG